MACARTKAEVRHREFFCLSKCSHLLMLEGKAAILNGPSLRQSHVSAILSMLTAEGSGEKHLLKYMAIKM